MEVKIKTPASSANIGPCFDCAGVALPLYNIMTVRQIPENEIRVVIDENGDIRKFTTDEKHIIFQTIKLYYEKIHKEAEGFEIYTETHIPIARGLGSSASVTAGTLIGINKINGDLLTQKELIDTAAQIEGHPDNTTPAFTGGFTVASIEEDGHVLYQRTEWPDEWKMTFCIPEYKLLTELARSVLPEKINFKDAVFNIRKSAQLITALNNKNAEMMRSALKDRIHQPFRAKLIPGMEEITEKLQKEQNVLGCVLSGAGPTLAVITEGSDIENVKQTVHKIWYDADIKYEIKTMVPEKTGAVII